MFNFCLPAAPDGCIAHFWEYFSWWHFTRQAQSITEKWSEVLITRLRHNKPTDSWDPMNRWNEPFQTAVWLACSHPTWPICSPRKNDWQPPGRSKKWGRGGLSVSPPLQTSPGSPWQLLVMPLIFCLPAGWRFLGWLARSTASKETFFVVVV